jgi:flagella basal body P-ring formation protein FlgA
VTARAKTAGYTELTVEFRSAPSSLPKPSEDSRLRIAAEPGAALRGTMGVPVEVIAGGTVAIRTVVSIRVRTFGIVPVASKRLDRHEPIAEGDIRVELTETTDLPGDVVTDARRLSGMRTSRIVAEGSVLRTSHIEALPLVRHDGIVRLIARTGRVAVTSEATATKDGALGETVLVVRRESREHLQARVVGEGIVEVVVR